MTDDKDKPVLRLVQKEVDRRTAEEKKAEYYADRSNKQKDFYSKARIATVSIQVLKEALLTSVIMDEKGQIIVEWDEALIESLLDDIKDPGPRTR